MTRTRAARAVVLAALAAACRGGTGTVDPGTRPEPVPEGNVQVWLTTGDRTKLLSRERNLAFTPAELSAPATIVVNPDEVFQEMVGFGASITDASAILIQETLRGPARDALMNELFGRDGGIGLAFTRLTVGASDFSPTHYSFDDVPAGQTDFALEHFSIEPNRAAVLPTVKQALAINPQLKVMASPWSAPGWMKTTGSLIKGTLRDDAYDAFAEYWVRYIEAYAAEGVPIWAITVQNEPHFEPENYPGMRLDPPQRARFLRDHLGPAFAREGIGTLVFDWDHNWDEPESPLAVIADAGARQNVDGVAWHCYGGEVSAQSRVHDAYPEIDAYFTECSGGGWAPNFGDNLKWFTATLIIGSTRHWARGVLLWNLARDERHGPHLGGCGDCRGVVTIDSRTGAVTRNEEYYALGHASRFVLPGARRIGSTSGVTGLESVAFRNPDGSTALIVVNTAGAARPFRVREGNESLLYTLPAGAVVTLRWP
ncbi:MAG TPA: glycoside hydrolase family 30 beta sandwich domain-containing protein [Gemmatimonadaceae bacterium]